MLQTALHGLHIPYASVPAPGPLIVFADVESQNVIRPHLTGGRRAWEVALCRREPDGEEFWFHGFIRLRDLPWSPDDPHLDRTGLDIGRFHTRHPEITGTGMQDVYSEPQMADIIRDWFRPMPGTDTRPILAGVVPDFDEQIFAQMLRTYGHMWSEGPWHFDTFNVATAVAARIKARPPFTYEELSRRIGVDPAAYDTHTALGDVQWARALHDAAYWPLWRIWAARGLLKARGGRSRLRRAA